jgi:phosphoribosylamine--glycine ligase
VIRPTHDAAGAGHVLVVDGSGRGHAICDLFVRGDPRVTVYYGPGCDVIEHDRIIIAPSISLNDPRTALAFLHDHPVELVFVSYSDALTKGYVDVLRSHGYATIGPSKAAAELESSKERGKRFCVDHGLPTAPYRFFTEVEPAKAYVRSLPYACVVKTDGLCKNADGSIVSDTVNEAEGAIDAFAHQFGDALRLVIEKRLRGPEISIFALLDGESYLLFPAAMDFKRTLDGDRGGNCEGMGAIAPHPMSGPELDAEICRTLLEPLLRGLRRDGLDFTGFVYLGAMITEDGLRVLEINTRFGDSEAEVVLPGIQNNFLELCRSVLDKTLRDRRLVTDGLTRCTVALTQGCIDPDDPEALPGWPFGEHAVGQEVRGLGDVDRSEAIVFCANLRRDSAGRPTTSGGRVLHVVGTGRSLEEARERAYRQVSRIAFPGMRYRLDIGSKRDATPPQPRWSSTQAQDSEE